jgi:Sec-independent protein translocase protein TatA
MKISFFQLVILLLVFLFIFGYSSSFFNVFSKGVGRFSELIKKIKKQ